MRSICIAAAKVSRVYQATMADRDDEAEATDANVSAPESEASDGFLRALRQAVARGWLTPLNENKPMDVELAEAIVASVKESWDEIECARRNEANFLSDERSSTVEERNHELKWDLIRGRFPGTQAPKS
jgi:hypothetical protein